MTTSTDYNGLVRLKNGSKEKYTIAVDVGSVEDAVKCLMTEVPNALTALVEVPMEFSHNVSPEVV